jgi:hypothetical protein
MAEIMYPDSLDGYATAASWLDNGRPDWISNTENTDRHYISIGAGTLFLFFLRYQLGLSWAKIVKAGRGQSTLAATYQRLTGRTTAYADFKAFSTGSGRRRTRPAWSAPTTRFRAPTGWRPGTTGSRSAASSSPHR